MPGTPASVSIETPANEVENKKTRKRKRNTDQWKTVAAKKATNFGMAGVSARKTSIDAKVIGLGCVNCRFKCQNKISFIDRKKLFDEFWKIEEHSRQWDYIARTISYTQKENMEANCNEECSSKRLNQRHFFLNTAMERIQVCREMYLQTFGK